MSSSTTTTTPPRPKQQHRRPPQPIPIAAPSPVQQQQHARSVPLPHHRPVKTHSSSPSATTRRRGPCDRPAPTLPPVTTTAPYPQGKRARNHK
ncbi:hypothetical protein DXG01_012942, partial [Tephrocybe rancida]